MSKFKTIAVATGILLICLGGGRMKARDSNSGGTKEIAAYKKFVELHLKMDTPGIMAMWAEDGVGLRQ